MSKNSEWCDGDTIWTGNKSPARFRSRCASSRARNKARPRKRARASSVSRSVSRYFRHVLFAPRKVQVTLRRMQIPPPSLLSSTRTHAAPFADTLALDEQTLLFFNYCVERFAVGIFFTRGSGFYDRGVRLLAVVDIVFLCFTMRITRILGCFGKLYRDTFAW